jgi:aspartate/methionine/tyrosine aminotransferase
MERVNPDVLAVGPPPIGDVHGWIRGVPFPPGRPLLDVAQAVPRDPPAEPLVAHLREVVGQPQSSLYTGILGIEPLREALADSLAGEYQGPVRPDDVGITAGCNQAFCVVTSVITAPGDEVIAPLPWYFNHQMWLAGRGVRLVGLPFDEASGGMPDPETAAAAITPRTRAIVLVTPNNPTGAEYPPELIEAFYRLAQARGLWLIIDETYKDFRARSEPAHSLLADPDWPRTLVQLHSFSKSYCLAGYRVGALVAAPGLLEQVEKILDCVAICPARVSQEAALFALAHLGAWRQERAAALEVRVEALHTGLAASGSGYRVAGSGRYFAYLRHPFPGEPAASVARRLATGHGVLCLPGSFFGPGQDPYLRIAFANLAVERIPTLVERLEDSVAAGSPVAEVGG